MSSTTKDPQSLPVDVEQQCAVTLPDGDRCPRSLTCKAHSMAAKRAVPDRSMPYDMLLQAYQKKLQTRQKNKAPPQRKYRPPNPPSSSRESSSGSHIPPERSTSKNSPS
ncbi:putative SAGA complex component (Sgf73) [Aspergillus nomiae NRRL 13137]|uniref:Putative SAGA complex component (Sgf73) n=1 Tax=Aspergillus nomiae NRRL (strain ATCC 15546 / NRRL 13137 / CBS 260.88 / M93) TaxID=1509407 RepID=A0A0L1IUU1_ASPN3|nr:putative SAGA complex component (Sgf73) [Aspergillus nomiae NRRL 13137]KNG83336.1 putative SAGA complex component (Sgf73) [Aspergillus nomiae NRRL 13137]